MKTKNDKNFSNQCFFCLNKTLSLQKILNKKYSIFEFSHKDSGLSIDQISKNLRLPLVIAFRHLKVFLLSEESKILITKFYTGDLLKRTLRELISKKSDEYKKPLLVPFHDLLLFKNQVYIKEKLSSKEDSNSLENNEESGRFSGLDFNENLDDNPFSYVKKSRKELGEEKMGSFLKDLDRHLEVLSFESDEFNIYNPDYSSEEEDTLQNMKTEDKTKLINQQMNKFNEKNKQREVFDVENFRKTIDKPNKTQKDQFLIRNSQNLNEKNHKTVRNIIKIRNSPEVKSMNHILGPSLSLYSSSMNKTNERKSDFFEGFDVKIINKKLLKK